MRFSLERNVSRIFLFGVIALLITANAHAQQTDATIASMTRNKKDNSPTSIYFKAGAGWRDNQALEIFSKYLGVDGKVSTMVEVYSTTTKRGVTAKRYNQYFKGVKVAYGSYSLTSKNGVVTFITGNFYNIDKSYSVSPSLTADDALSKALAFVGAEKYMWQDPVEEKRIKAMYRKADTSFLPKGVLVMIQDFRGDANERTPHLAWMFNIYAQQPLSRQEVYVDAVTGKVLHTNSLIKHTAATGRTKYSGVVNFETSNTGATYQLFDSTRGNGVHTLNMNNGTSYGAATLYTSVANTWPLLPADTIALDAHWGAEIVYDYWRTEQGRHSYDGSDGILMQYVHYGSGFNNAFWNGSEMTYGDGTGCSSGFMPLASLDVTAHEIGHGVCEYTANLVYAMESGALNESFSDCWGATIEAWSGVTEVDAIAKNTWAMGEEIDCGTPLRRMDFPKLKNDPDTYGGTYWTNQVGCIPSSGNDQCGVHNNSGVMNKWYYLVVNGGSGTNDLSNAYSVTGIGFGDGGDILYQSELVLSPTADYDEMRTASINAAVTMFGGCSQQAITVTNAWYAVGVGAPYVPYPANITGLTNICVGGTTLLSDATPGGTWSSSFPSIATVTAGGLVTGVTPGIDTIIYSVGTGCDAKAIVTVNSFPTATISPAPTASMCAGGSIVLAANPGVGYTYQWQLGGSNIPGATNINYAATAAGNYTVRVAITVGCDALSAITNVTTVALPLAVITPASSTTFCNGGSVVLNANLGVGYTYQWQHDGLPISGAVGTSYTATLAGNYTVIVTNPSGCSATSANRAVVVNPLPAPITGMPSLCVGMTTNLTNATAGGAWSSSNPAIATVGTATGIVSGVTAGGANITYTVISTGCFISAPVTVNIVPAPISGAANVCLGLSTALSNSVPGGVWSSSNSGVAAVAGATGLVTGASAGTATITYTMGAGCFETLNMVVNPLPAAITGPGSVCSGASITLGNTSPGGSWSSGSTGIATIGAGTGTLTGMGAGVANITYTLPTTCIRTTVVTVNTVSAAPISGPGGVCLGQSISLTDATPGGTWSSSNPTVAIVNPLGGVIGAALGSANITYTVTNPCGVAFAIMPLTVNPLPVVAPVSGTLTVCSGNSALVTNATPGGVWSTANPSVATISTGGMVTGVVAGTVNVSYTVTNSLGCVSRAVAPFNVFHAFPVSVTPAGPVNVCTGASVMLTASTGTGYTYQWRKNGAIISGATTTSFGASTTGTYTMLETAPGGCNSVSAPVVVNVDPTMFVVTPTVSFSAHPGLTLCAAGLPDTFVAGSTHGGIPAYQWYVNGTPVATGATYSYTPAHGDVVRCVLTSTEVCAYPATASRTDTVKVGVPRTPAVAISASAGTVCYGQSVTYTAVPTYGGTAPTYSWTLNGINVGTGAPTFTFTPTNGDVLKCRMVSNYPCVATPVVTATQTITVQSLVPHTVTIYVTKAGIAAGLPDTFVAVAPYAGSSPAYQWFINSVPVPGATNANFITATLADKDEVSCTVASGNPCVYPGTVRSSGIRVRVYGVGVNEVAQSGGDFLLLPNPNKGEFTITGTLTNTGDEEVTITITNLLGQNIYTATAIIRNGVVNEKINLSNSVANGVYLVGIATSEGREVFHVVVEK